MKILLIGNGAREHALAEAIARSPQQPELVVLADKNNPGIVELAATYKVVSDLTDQAAIRAFAEEQKPEIAVLGSDPIIAAGAADTLLELGIPSFGPTRQLAQLEASKGFTRALQQEFDISGAPEFAVYKSEIGEEVDKDLRDAIRAFMEGLGGEFVVKADGLTGGKGVMVTGDHLAGVDDGLVYALECLQADGRVVIEEKLVGEEFSLMYLTDGETLVPCPAVQDHKRAFEGDKGPNTGGMGSYSAADHSLPFLEPGDLAQAEEITRQILRAVQEQEGGRFIGVLYGGFMVTRTGTKLIEYNVRFGDPEAMNVLPIMQTDFVAFLQAAVDGKLKDLSVEFAPLATVVKYAVPDGYPNIPKSGEVIEIGELPAGCRVYYAAVDSDGSGSIRTSSSRALGFVGMAETLGEAEQLAEAGVSAVSGALFHRTDIGTSELIQKRIDHMKSIRND